MPEEKKSRGRPRIYPTNAARKKAYRERKKAERLQLIEQVEQLQQKIDSTNDAVSIKNIDDPIFSLTLGQLESKTSTELRELVETINKKFPEKRDLNSPLSILVDDIIESTDPLGFNLNVKISSNKAIAKEASENYRKFESLFVYLVILYIAESIIAKREDKDTSDYELELLEKKITELEQAVAKKKEEDLKIEK